MAGSLSVLTLRYHRTQPSRRQASRTPSIRSESQTPRFGIGDQATTAVKRNGRLIVCFDIEVPPHAALTPASVTHSLHQIGVANSTLRHWGPGHNGGKAQWPAHCLF